MKLTVFQSDKGDCLLLTSVDGHHLLIDGGMRSSYREFVAPALGELRERGETLDLVYVSHIDEDHISGVLQLMDDIVAWRVHDYHIARGNHGHKEPAASRPPEIGAIWHNAFRDMVGENSGRIQDMLAATAAILGGSESAEIRRVGQTHQELATSVKQGIQLSRRISDKQLGIPLNPEHGHRLMFVRDEQLPIRIGPMSIFVIGPFKEDLEKLLVEWNNWLRDHEAEVKKLRRTARDDEELLGASEVDQVLQPALAQARRLGRRDKVTAPNLASLMLLVEEGTRRVLLTGDGHYADILRGLRHNGKLDADGRIHVDVLKVQHHGSEHNINEDFCKAVTADHYVFCGNGAHDNPDLEVVRLIVDSRRKDAGKFKLWFNSSSAVAQGEQQRAHMEALEVLVNTLIRPLKGRAQVSFLTAGASFELSF